MFSSIATWGYSINFWLYFSTFALTQYWGCREWFLNHGEYDLVRHKDWFWISWLQLWMVGLMLICLDLALFMNYSIIPDIFLTLPYPLLKKIIDVYLFHFFFSSSSINIKVYFKLYQSSQQMNKNCSTGWSLWLCLGYNIKHSNYLIN